jgi:hypothetical protein
VVRVADSQRRMAGFLLFLSKKKSGFAVLLFNKRVCVLKSFSSMFLKYLGEFMKPFSG